MNDLDDLLRELDDIPSAAPAPSTSKPSAPARAAPPPLPTVRVTAAPSAPALRSSDSGTSAAYQPKPAQVKPSISYDLDEFDDITPLAPVAPVGRTSGSGSAATTSTAAAAATGSGLQVRVKCTQTYMGGADAPRGRQGHPSSSSSLAGLTRPASASVTCCDNLRCTKCDFRVLALPDVEWQPDVDYLFFRNCYPTEPKLRQRTQQRPGAASYCCQCSWASVTAPVLLGGFGSELRWVCGGHT